MANAAYHSRMSWSPIPSSTSRIPNLRPRRPSRFNSRYWELCDPDLWVCCGGRTMSDESSEKVGSPRGGSRLFCITAGVRRELGNFARPADASVVSESTARLTTRARHQLTATPGPPPCLAAKIRYSRPQKPGRGDVAALDRHAARRRLAMTAKSRSAVQRFREPAPLGLPPD